MNEEFAGRNTLNFLAGGGAIGTFIRANDWSGTPLGPPEGWPYPLRILVSVMLGSKQSMFILWGAERTLLYNDDYAHLLGDRHPDALGQPFLHVWDEVRKVFGPIIDRAFDGEPTQMDDLSLVLHRHGRREEAHFAFSATPVRDQDGRIGGVFCVCTETTARMVIERRQALRFELEERLRDLADPKAMTSVATDLLGRHLGTAKIGYAMVGDDGYVTTDAEFNDGRMRSTAYQRHFLSDYGPDVETELKAGHDIVIEDVWSDPRTSSPTSLAASAAIGLRAYVDVPLVKEGRLVALLYAAHHEPRNWSKGDVALIRDVAERTWAAVERAHAEAALQESEARFRHLADNAPVMVWVTEPDGRSSYVSQSWHDFTGRGPGAARNFGWLDTLHPDDREAVARNLREANARRVAFQNEYRMRRHDGEWRWVIDTAVPRLGEDGRFFGYVGSVIDITERKTMEVALREAKDEAERTNASKSKFLAAASHDLRQPLQSALLYAGVLHGNLQDGQARKLLTSLERALETLKSLFDSLLDISRLDAGVIVPHIADVPLAPLLAELGDAYRPVAANRGLDFRVEPPPGATALRTDPVLLGRMLRNLLENAIRFTERGHVRLLCEPAGNGIRLKVEDSGIGIPKEHLDKVFEEFHQIGNPERDRNQGMGMGLAIVRRLSGLLRHPVAVRSEPGKGAVFSIEVPSVPLSAQPPTPAEPAAEAAGRGRLVVLVDDDAMVLKALRTIFQEWGYTVVIAGSAEQALERLRTVSRVPDLIVADYRLRDQKVGTEAVSRIRKQVDARVPGIILTGEIGSECESDAAAHGMTLVRKPITPRQLLAVMQTFPGPEGH